MKTGMWMLAACAALVASVQADGVCYDPDHVSSKTINTVYADAKTILGKGFTGVRTYIAQFGGTDMVTALANSGLRLAIGIPLSSYASHMDAVNSAVKTGMVDMIFVGNEEFSPSSLVAAIKIVKAQVGSVPVGTALRTTELAANPSGLSDVIAASDVIGANIHPFFTAGTTGDTALAQTKAQWNAILKANPSLDGKLVISETGWPTNGEYSGNYGSVSGATSYLNAFKSWATFLADDYKYMFQMFDQPKRTELYEQTFGILTYDSQDKVSVTGTGTSTSSTTATPTTATPTTTPTPTTTATPTTTPTPTTTATATSATTAQNTTSASASAGSSKSGSSSSASKTGSSSGNAGSSATGSAADSLDGSVASLDDSSEGSSSGASGDSSASAGVGGSEVGSGYSSGTVTSAANDESGTTSTTQNGGTSTSSTANAGSQTANAQTSEKSSSSGSWTTFLMIGCVAVVGAFGFIYKARRSAAEFDEEDLDIKGGSQLSTPTENICVL